MTRIMSGLPSQIPKLSQTRKSLSKYDLYRTAKSFDLKAKAR